MSYPEPIVAGLPWTAFLLFLAPAALGLGIVLFFYLRYARR